MKLGQSITRAARWLKASAVGAVTLGLAATAAVAGMGQPTQGQLGMQIPATPIAETIVRFHDAVNLVIIAIALFVLILMAICVFRFSERANPVPSKTTHHTGLEIAWTIIPVFILIGIAIPSFRLLYDQYSFPKADVTIKAIGNAWFWEHEYLDEKGVRVTSNMIKDEDLLIRKFGKAEVDKRYQGLSELERVKRQYTDAKPLWAEYGMVRQLSVNNDIAVPVNKVVSLLITSNDVIHSWTIPSFGSRMQAVPGRVTATWFKPTKTGVFYGQCSVLCGKEHSGMPIAVRVVSEKAYADWIAAVKARDMNRARQILQAATEPESATKFAAAQ
jgi:cytochrome c oxidase subunit II